MLSGVMPVALNTVAARYAAYLAQQIPDVVHERDIMLARGTAGAMDHYLAVGHSAIEVIAVAMLAVGTIDIGSVLDLPCGGGRVTRHLKAFLPEAELSVGDLDRELEAFTAKTFGAIVARAPVDFAGAPVRSFDLIFVGSLVTHLDAAMFAQATRWLIAALAPNGLLVLTTHGRRHDFVETTRHRFAPLDKWEATLRALAREGFGYYDYDDTQPGYGVSVSKPSWVMRLFETEPAIRIVSYQEAAWAGHQDVLVLQRKAINS